VEVVDHVAEIEDGRTIRADDDEVVELGVLEHDRALHQVGDRRLPVEWRAEAEREGGSLGGRTRALAAGAVVGRPAARGERRLPARFELVRCAVAAVEMPGGEELLGAGAVEIGARALEVRPLVPREPEPGEALDDRLDRFGRRALAIRVLDAEHKASAMVACEQVAEEGGAHPTDVERAGRAGREASPDRHARELSRWVGASQLVDTPECLRVRVLVPILRVELGEFAQRAAAGAGRTSFMLKKILVVEDNEDNRRILVYRLRKIGRFDIREAANGQQAIEAVKVERPDLIFMDLKMPVMDGWEATKRIHEMDGGEAIRIIA